MKSNPVNKAFNHTDCSIKSFKYNIKSSNYLSTASNHVNTTLNYHNIQIQNLII